jgi:2-dehydro-3-deoxyphosphooctonate aldolase (KDO 8-P synthase)
MEPRGWPPVAKAGPDGLAWGGMHPLQTSLEKGGKARPFWIAGPCVIESRETNARIAETLKKAGERLGVPVVFKASFDKANRTSHASFRGLGLEAGLEELLWVKRQFDLPILTDIHESSQAGPVSEVADILQIPAFLCRQTDLLAAAARTGRCVNVKKGQFLDPTGARNLVAKLTEFGAKGYWLTERGVSFGYQRLIVDFAGFPEMERSGAHLVMDITHSVQLPGAAGDATGGNREAIPHLARAAAAAGVHGFFAESHPEPAKSKSDAANAWPLDQLEALMKSVCTIAGAAHG